VNGPHDPRAAQLLQRLRQALPSTETATDTGEDRRSDQGSGGPSSVYRASVLTGSQQHGYATLSAEFIDPPITFGEAACASWMQQCSTRDLAGNATAVITGGTGSATMLVEVYRADHGVPLRLRAGTAITSDTSLFWQGGTPAAQAPISPDALVALAESLIKTPV